MNFERMLARLKKERRGIDDAISALEKLRAADSRERRKGIGKSKKRRSKASKTTGGQSKPEAQQDRHAETKVVDFPPAAKRVG